MDAWLWAVRVFPTRSAATAACRAGHVRLNGERVKAAQLVRIGDELRIRVHGFDRVLGVAGIAVKRVGAPVAATLADDRTPPPPPATETAAPVRRDRGAGRPTKRERRDIERLRSH